MLTSWRDLGPILTSDPSKNYNAIDPDVFFDGRRWWIAFGSFWDGLKMQRLADMTRPYGPIVSLARHPDNPPNPIENPQLFHHGRHWYLLASWDFCCQGVNSTYKTIVGRSTRPDGRTPTRCSRPAAAAASSSGCPKGPGSDGGALMGAR